VQDALAMLSIALERHTASQAASGGSSDDGVAAAPGAGVMRGRL
jgi:hypothetical protein